MEALITLALSAIAILFLHIKALVWKAGRKQQSIEDKQATLIMNIEKLVKDKDEVHREIIAQMREDRTATNKRLRWLEENVWNEGKTRRK